MELLVAFVGLKPLKGIYYSLTYS